VGNEETTSNRPPDPLLGTVINDKFKLVSLIGRGGMGKIYKAEQLSLGRMVAIKLLSIVDKTNNVEQFRERFYREASLCARLSHPNIVTIHDYGSVDDAEEETLWIAMEYLEGKTLLQRLAGRRRLVPAEATAIVVEIARGIRDAHKHGLVHRDLKCSNVMLVPDEEGGTRIKILDFGLVKSLSLREGEEELTLVGNVFLGSPGYMSPEQIQRGMTVDHRTDIYSLGVVLFRCLAGRNPYEGDEAQVLLAHVNSPLPWLKEANADVEVPAELEVLMRMMLEKDADKRVASAEEVVRTLRDIQELNGWTKSNASLYDNFSKPQLLVLDPTPTTGGTFKPVAVSQTPPKKQRIKIAAVLGFVGIAVSATMIMLLRHPSSPEEGPSPGVAHVSAAAPARPAPPPEEPAPKPEPAAEPAPPPVPVAAPAHVPPRTPVKRAAPKAKPPVVAAPAPAPSPAPAPASKPTPPLAAQAETGFLSLDTTPWSNVSEGGRSLGQTPLIRVKMSEGAHTLTLTTEHGVSRSFIVDIKAGQTTSKRLGLE
jgi:serine/threonine-protein kinase